MFRARSESPDLLPMLSRGKHRSPRLGACFMELASVLAGERWSDHPRCTHPLLGELARMVNDSTSDAGRSRLAVLIPSVVGLRSDDLRVDARIALRCARVALPVAAAERQNVMAVSVRTADRVLAVLDARPVGDLEPASREALASVPAAAAWSDNFVRRAGISVNGFRRHAAPNTVRGAVQAIAESTVADPDAVLHDLFEAVVDEVAVLCGRTTSDSRTERPASVPTPA